MIIFSYSYNNLGVLTVPFFVFNSLWNMTSLDNLVKSPLLLQKLSLKFIESLVLLKNLLSNKWKVEDWGVTSFAKAPGRMCEINITRCFLANRFL